MSISLRLLPIDHLKNATWGYCHSVLEVGYVDEHEFEAIRKTAMRLPTSHSITSLVGARVTAGKYKGEPCYGVFERSDAYGEPYTWTLAADVLPILQRNRPKEPVTAYLRALVERDDQTLVVLDWH